jgi:hypothetical protein
MKLPHINFKLFVAWLALCALGGALLGWVSGMPFLGGAAIVAAALVINGVVAEVEDRAPGGLLNPGSKSK